MEERQTRGVKKEVLYKIGKWFKNYTVIWLSLLFLWGNYKMLFSHQMIEQDVKGMIQMGIDPYKAYFLIGIIPCAIFVFATVIKLVYLKWKGRKINASWVPQIMFYLFFVSTGFPLYLETGFYIANKIAFNPIVIGAVILGYVIISLTHISNGEKELSVNANKEEMDKVLANTTNPD